MTQTAEQRLSIHTASNVDQGGDGEAEMSREICINCLTKFLERGGTWLARVVLLEREDHQVCCSDVSCLLPGSAGMNGPIV